MVRGPVWLASATARGQTTIVSPAITVTILALGIGHLVAAMRPTSIRTTYAPPAAIHHVIPVAMAAFWTGDGSTCGSGFASTVTAAFGVVVLDTVVRAFRTFH